MIFSFAGMVFILVERGGKLKWNLVARHTQAVPPWRRLGIDSDADFSITAIVFYKIAGNGLMRVHIRCSEVSF